VECNRPSEVSEGVLCPLVKRVIIRINHIEVFWEVLRLDRASELLDPGNCRPQDDPSATSREMAIIQACAE